MQLFLYSFLLFLFSLCCNWLCVGTEAAKQQQQQQPPEEQGQKQYAVVKFGGAENIEVVPTSWLINNDTQIKWPAKKSLMFAAGCIRECVKPQEDWEDYNIGKVCSFHKSFKSAHNRAEYALDTSTIESESSSSEEEELIRKRKKPSRYCSSSEEKTKKIFRFSNVLTCPQGGSSSQSLVGFSSPSPQSGSLVSSRVELNSTINNKMWEQVFSVLEQIKEDVREVKENQLKILNQQMSASIVLNNGTASSVLIELPEDINFPITNDEALMQLDNKLRKDVNLQCLLINYFETISNGKSIYAFLLNLCRRLISMELAMTYSRLGRKGKKCFENLTAMTNTILAAALKRFKEASRQDIAEKFGKVLATASDWEGRKTTKATSSTDSLFLETVECINEYNKL
nr:uncharacterized protein LOC107455994 isoform X5 [Parasteatoda tepidariorum]